MRSPDSFLISDLLDGYRSGRFTPTEVVEAALRRADLAAQRHVWITRLSRERVLAQARTSGTSTSVMNKPNCLIASANLS